MFKTIRKHSKTIVWLIVMAFILWGGSSLLVSQSKGASYAGEAFGTRVTHKEFSDVTKIVNLFTDPRLLARTSFEEQVWLNIVFQREASRRKISVLDAEVTDQIRKLFKGGTDFDRTRYEWWVQNVLREDPRNFEELVREFIRIQKLLYQTIADTPEPTAEQILRQYGVENHALVLEFARFDDLKEAQAAYDKTKTPELWEAEKKENPVWETTGGYVSRDALGERWALVESDLDSLFELGKGAVSTPIPSGQKFVLFHVLDEKKPPAMPADPATRELYRKKTRDVMARARVKEWSQKLLGQARIRKF